MTGYSGNAHLLVSSIQYTINVLVSQSFFFRKEQRMSILTCTGSVVLVAVSAVSAVSVVSVVGVVATITTQMLWPNVEGAVAVEWHNVNK